MIDRILNIDRRYIFAVIFVVVVWALMADRPIQVPISSPVQDVFDFMERVAQIDDHPPTILISFDYGPGSDAEVQPMALALLRHAFSKGVRVAGMCIWETAPGLAKAAFETVAPEFDKKYGDDYVFLGYKSGGIAVVLNMGQDFSLAFPADAYGNRTDTLATTARISRLADFDYVITLAAGNTIDQLWVAYGQDRYKINLGGGVTAVMAPDMFPFLQTGQLNGLIPGLAGAAEYEKLIEHPGEATAGMLAQSWTHIAIVLSIVFGNVAYFISRRRDREV